MEVEKIDLEIEKIENEIIQFQSKLNKLREIKETLILVKSLKDDFIICFECSCKVKKTALEDALEDINYRIKRKLKVYCNECHNSDIDSDDYEGNNN